MAHVRYALQGACWLTRQKLKSWWELEAVFVQLYYFLPLRHLRVEVPIGPTILISSLVVYDEYIFGV